MPKFGRKVHHLRCDSRTSFKVKRSKVRVEGGREHTVSAEPGGHITCYFCSFLQFYALGSCFMQVICHVESGRTLDRPPGCPDAVYQLMLGCWRRQPQDRLTITEIYQCLDLFVDMPTSSKILTTTPRSPVKNAVALGNASPQHLQPVTTTPNVPYIELVSASEVTSYA